MFNAFLVDETDGERTASVHSIDMDALPEGDTVVDVLYSSINYKDALALTGRGKILRGELPMAPGIDLVGRVVSSESEAVSTGDLVIGTGWQLGEGTWGGYTQRARLDAEKLVPLPDGLTPAQSMVVGTAGLTAMLSVMALEEHDVQPGRGEVLVTGASGGAGSMAVTFLAALGYDVAASTGSEDAHAYLKDLGAARIVPRSDFDEGPSRPMESGQWAGAVDAVGGKTLATVIAQLERHGSVAAFGNAGGHALETTVFPFILRGVNLLGIDSNTCPTERRLVAWTRIAGLLDDDRLNAMTNRTVGLDALPDVATEILDRGVRGRVVVDLNA